MKKLPLTLLFLGSALLLPSCIIAIGDGAADAFHSSWGWSGKRGSGVSATQTRAVQDFHSVRLDDSSFVDITVGPELSVALTADDNLIDDLTTVVRDGVLVISMRDGVDASFRIGPSVRITVPTLRAVSVDGSGTAVVKGLSGEKFSASLQGSGDLTANGKVTSVNVELSGSGDVDLSGVECQDANVALQGSGDVRVRASSSLTAAISGSGNIEYLGSPPRTSISVSGSGEVHPVQ